MNTKELIQSLLPGWNGRLAAHHVGYLGDSKVHRAVPYNALDPKVITKKLQLMQSDGVDVVIETWQGIYATACNQDAILTSSLCTQMGLQFCLLLDPWCAKLSASGSNSNYTQNVISSLQAQSTQTILNSPSYIPEKYILDFNTGASLIALSAHFPVQKFLAEGIGFSWISIPTLTDSVQRNAAAVANLKSQHNNYAMKVCSVCSNFNDAGQPLPVGVATQTQFDITGGERNYLNSVWGGSARVLDSYSGMFLQQQIQTIPSTVPIIALITWDDYDEQSSGPREKVIAEQLGINWSSL